MGVGAFLQDLLDQRQYQKCLEAAEQLLAATGHTAEDLIELNLAVCRARLNLREYTLAVAPGMIARKVASDANAYVLLDRVYYTLTTAMFYTNQFERALSVAYEYFEAVPLPYRTPGQEGMIWHAIAFVYGDKLFEYEKAVDASAHAVRCLEKANDPDNLLRSAVLMALNYIPLKNYGLARHWIYRCMKITRGLPPSHWGKQMVMLRRAQVCYAEGDATRAMVLAHRSLQRDHGYGFEDLRFDALMLLCRICMDAQEYKDALGYALAARVGGLDSKLYWREYEAAETMMKIIALAGDGIVAELDQEYLATGVDMTRYVSESFLKSRD